MPFNGAGTFTRLNSWVQDRIAGIFITAERHDASDNDIATALSMMIARDGQSTVIGDIPMNNHKLVGLVNGVNAGDSANKGQLDAVNAKGFIFLGTGSASDFVNSGVFQNYLNVDWVATSPLVDANAGGSMFHLGSSGTICAARLRLRNLTAGVDVFTSMQQSFSVVYGEARPFHVQLQANGLTVGTTYRLSLQLYRDAAVGPTNINELILGGVQV